MELTNEKKQRIAEHAAMVAEGRKYYSQAARDARDARAAIADQARLAENIPKGGKRKQTYKKRAKKTKKGRSRRR